MVSLKKNNIKTWIKKNIILLGTSILLLIVMHLPFLQSDPDAFVDVNTRGAWTDEGLYSSQIINYINTGEFNIEENNQMVISPLFTALLYPFYLIFGTNVLVGRLVVLFFISFNNTYNFFVNRFNSDNNRFFFKDFCYRSYETVI